MNNFERIDRFRDKFEFPQKNALILLMSLTGALASCEYDSKAFDNVLGECPDDRTPFKVEDGKNLCLRVLCEKDGFEEQDEEFRKAGEGSFCSDMVDVCPDERAPQYTSDMGTPMCIVEQCPEGQIKELEEQYKMEGGRFCENAMIDMPIDMGMDAGMDMDPDMPADMGMDAGMDMDPDMPADMEMGAGMDMDPDMPADMGMDAGMDMAPDMPVDMGIQCTPAMTTKANYLFSEINYVLNPPSTSGFASTNIRIHIDQGGMISRPDLSLEYGATRYRLEDPNRTQIRFDGVDGSGNLEKAVVLESRWPDMTDFAVEILSGMEIDYSHPRITNFYRYGALDLNKYNAGVMSIPSVLEDRPSETVVVRFTASGECFVDNVQYCDAVCTDISTNITSIRSR